MRRCARSLAAAAALAVVAAAVAAGAPAAPATALEGLRLAALAERIAKLHAQLGHGIMPARSRRSLDEALREFDAASRALAARPAAAEARENQLLLAILWREYREWAARPPTRDNVRKLADRAEEVAWVAAKAARSPQAESSLAVQALRGCALAQRLPRLYLERRWEPRNPATARGIAAASAELAGLVERLRGAGEAGADAAAQLQVAEAQLGFLTRAGAAAAAGEGGAALEHAAKAGDHVLEALGRAARLYEAAGL